MDGWNSVCAQLILDCVLEDEEEDDDEEEEDDDDDEEEAEQ